jgi:hypothetical protein
MFIISILTIIVSSIGIFYSKIYKDLVNTGKISEFVFVGSVNQDLLSLLNAVLLLIISSMLLKRNYYKLYILALGLVSYIFYSYSVYTFGGMLTPLYLIYIVIFTLSVYCLIIGGLSFNSKEIGKKLKMEKRIRNSIGIFLIVMVTIMSIKWVSDILSGSFKYIQPELYLIAAMDLGVVLPAYGVFAFMILKNNIYGVIFSGISLINIFTLCFSIVLGTFIAPHFGVPFDYTVLYFFSVLTIVSFIFITLYMTRIYEIK